MRRPRRPNDPRHRLEDPRDVARRELRDGERLIWADRPNPAVVKKRNLGTFIVAIPFTAFACFWMWGAGQGFGQSVFSTIFPFFGLPFLGVGLWMLSSPLRAARQAQNTVYAITDQRLLIAMGSQNRSIQSFGPRDITKVERNEREDGLGDVIFGEDISWRSGNNRWKLRSGRNVHVEDVGFFGIADAREVEAEVVKLRRSVAGAAAT